MNKREIAFLLLVASNEGQLKPKEVSINEVRSLKRKEMILEQKVRNSLYYYVTPKGKKFTSMLFSIAENTFDNF